MLYRLRRRLVCSYPMRTVEIKKQGSQKVGNNEISETPYALETGQDAIVDEGLPVLHESLYTLGAGPVFFITGCSRAMVISSFCFTLMASRRL